MPSPAASRPSLQIRPFDYPLQIELVPKRAWGHNLRALIPATQWDKIKNAVFEQAGFHCEICHGQGQRHPVECHERWTFDESKRLQRLDGLIALCPRCHLAKHLGFAMRNRSPEDFDKIMAHLARVNGIGRDEADKYVEWVFAIQRRRANMAWVMDLRWLERHCAITWSAEARRSSMLIRDAA